MDILKRIKQLQDERNWSRYQLSAETMIPQSTINNMFSRNTLPSMASLIAMCNAFNITLSEFFNEDNSNITLSEDERQLVLGYRKLNKKNKHLINLMINELNS